MSVLTSRYSASPESTIDYDIRNISEKSFPEYFKIIEDGDLSDAYWNVTLVQALETSVSIAPVFHAYLAAQVKNNDKGFLSRDITVNNLITNMGDIHHLFPKNFLKNNGLNRSSYNQVANFVYMQSEINIKVGDKAPNIYFSDLREQATNGGLKYGGIQNMSELLDNLRQNSIPEGIFEMEIDNYKEFLVERQISHGKENKGVLFLTITSRIFLFQFFQACLSKAYRLLTKKLRKAKYDCFKG